jgi:hypothetical protein
VARHVLGLVPLALVAAACGGKHAARPPLSPEAFRAQANRVCEQAKTHAGRLAGLRKLKPPLADQDLYSRWLKAERDAIEAAKPPPQTSTQPLYDPQIPLTVAEGKIAGYARRLGAAACE